jgi:MinD-like ATPase involved in chromosome partitioning or flagellar assembly
MSNDDPYRGAFQQQPIPAPPSHPVGPARGRVQVQPPPASVFTPAAPRWGEEPAPYRGADLAPTGQAFAEATAQFQDVVYDPDDQTPDPDYAAGHGPEQGFEAGTDYGADYGGDYSGEHDPGPVYHPAAPPPARPPAVYNRPVPAARDTYLPVERAALDDVAKRGKSVPAKNGWRGKLHKITRLNVAPGKDELYEMSLEDRVLRIVRSTFPIAVIGVKGGVGKTVVTEALASTFSKVRGGRVVAVDIDADAGNLVSRHGRESALSITDLVADSSLRRYLDVRAHTSRNKETMLEVLSGPDFARTDLPLRHVDLEAAMPILKEHYSVVLMDTGSGLKTNLMTAVLGQSRALVVVSSASFDALEETQITLDWLRHNGYQQLLDTAVLVINTTVRGKLNVDVAKVVEQFSRQVRAERIFVTPFDDHIHEGKEITLELLSPKSRRRYLEVAAAVADLFPKIAG